jgi:glycosyltransferase involved in cell wall biosynthesis
MPPKVSVVMPVYNAEKYLAEAIESILNQTLTDFEFIIVNDGSTDDTLAIIENYQNEDDRIKCYIQDNKGQSMALNVGVDAAVGQYIALMDSDDISLPTRLEEQVIFLESHTEYGIVGTWARTFGNETKNIQHPTDNEIIKSYLLFFCPFIHPSVMIRRKYLLSKRLYYDTSRLTQDYDLWVRSSRYFKLANIPKILLNYRVHSQQISSVKINEMKNSRKEVHKDQITFLDINPTEVELELHHNIGQMAVTKPSQDFVQQAEVWLQRLYFANQQKNIYPESQFSELLTERWFMIGYHVAAPLGWREWLYWMRSPLSKNVSLLNKIKIVKQCIVNSFTETATPS